MSLRYRNAISALVSVLLVVGACGSGSSLKADAGPDSSVAVGDSPTFDGCASEGDIQNYQWRIIEAPDLMEGDSGKLIRETGQGCSFALDAAMGPQEVGTWIVELTVIDAESETSTDTVRVEITSQAE